MKRNLMVVDDDEDIRVLLEAYLAGKGFNVITAASGKEGLEKYGTDFDGLVITDLDMPEMDGIEFLARLKERDSDCIGIMLTGKGCTESCITSLRDGLAYDYLLKPLENMDLLLAACEKAWEKKNLELHNRELMDALKRNNEDLQLAAKVFENTVEGIIVTDRDAVILKVNQAFTSITGYAEDEVIGKKTSILKSDRHDRAFFEDMWKALLGNGQWQGRIWNRRKNGEAFLGRLTITSVKDESGRATHYSCIFYDITENKKEQDHIKTLAYHDALTGLPNRLLFNDRLAHAIERKKRHEEELSVFFLDLDHFKEVNDSLGHQIGDLLLAEAALRLSGCVRKEDTVSRRGGDEFIILLESHGAGSDYLKTAQRIKDAMRKPFQLDGHEVSVSASIGIALFPLHGMDPETLVKNADTAMYLAKEKGKNNFQVFQQPFN